MASVRGGRTIYRDEEDDGNHRSYTTIKRYQVPENIARSVYQGDEEVDKKIVIKRGRRAPSPQPSRVDDVEYRVTERVRERDPSPREETDWRFTERVIERERSHDPPPRRDVHYRVVERDSDARSIIRVPSPPSPERVTREFRFERERDFSQPRERPYELEKYSKSTEYFAQPQPIIIRESAPAAPIIIREERREPQKIIIREERREPQYEFVERKEATEERDESRSLVKSVQKEESPPPTPAPAPASEPAAKPEEDYFYERRVIERRRRSDSYDRKTEIRPRDSASQYSSDDSYEYVRRTTYEDGSRSRSRSRKRELAGGALVGAAAAEVYGHHRRQKGEKPHRGRNAIGGAALGAASVEAASRIRRSKSVRGWLGGSRSRSRSAERYDDRYDDRRSRKHRSRSRSAGGFTRTQTLGSLAAVAAVGALAGYAIKKRGNKETVIVNDAPPHRSRSRRRRHSYDETEIIRPESDARDPDHRNRRIAQAGLASAAAAGIIEKVRSSRSKSRHRSKSRVRQGVPIAAAGLGGAALAGLYEKNKANKEAKKDAIIEDELHRGRDRHSRSRSRPRARGLDDSSYDDRSYDDRSRGAGPGMIAYGNDPIYPDSRRGDYYSDEEPGMYRRRGGSRSSSPDTRRGHSRSRNLAAGAAAGGAAGAAAHEYGRHRSRSRVAKENRRRDDEYYGNGREPEEPYSPPPMGGNGFQQPPYGQQPTYPSSHYFPPPPTGDTTGYGGPNAYPAYNPADYAGQPAQQHPYDATYGGYGNSDANLGQPHLGDTYAGDERHNDPRSDGRRGRSPENMV